MVEIDDKLDMIVENYKPKTKIEYDHKKRVVSILNKIRYSMLDFYYDPNSIAAVHKNSNIVN